MTRFLIDVGIMMFMGILLADVLGTFEGWALALLMGIFFKMASRHND